MKQDVESRVMLDTLKCNKYRAEDWGWLIKRVEGKINNWCYRWLTLGGRMTFIKSTLEGLLVYYFTLTKIAKSTINKIQKCMSNFLWNDRKCSPLKHFLKWDMWAQPNQRTYNYA